MAVFSTNQVRHLYVAKAVNGGLQTTGDVKFGKIEADQLFKSYSTLRNKNEISSEELKLLHLVKAEINFLKS